MKLRSGLLAGLVLLALAIPQAVAAADDYPKRQIKIIVPFPAGAGPDQVARMLGQYLQEALGQAVIIENRAGALGSIGATEVARSTPDGYTLLMGTNTTQAANVAMLKDLPYDPAKDFAPIIRTVTTAMVLVVKPDFPARDLAQFMEYARAHPHMTAGYGSGASQISIGQLQSRGVLSGRAAGRHRRDGRRDRPCLCGFFAGYSANEGRHAARHRRDIAGPERADARPPSACRGHARFRGHDLVRVIGAGGHARTGHPEALCRERKIPVIAGNA